MKKKYFWVKNDLSEHLLLKDLHISSTENNTTFCNKADHVTNTDTITNNKLFHLKNCFFIIIIIYLVLSDILTFKYFVSLILKKFQGNVFPDLIITIFF